MEPQVKEEILAFVKRSKSVILSVTDAKGAPMQKALSLLGNYEFVLYFTTTRTSAFCAQFSANKPVSAYLLYDDPDNLHPGQCNGLSLSGHVEAVTDRPTKERFWQDRFSRNYPNGVDDENYNLLRFVPKGGKYFRVASEGMFSTEFEL